MNLSAFARVNVRQETVIKAILEFILPEDHTEFDTACRAQDYLNALTDVRELLRSLEKYDNKTTVEISKIREIIAECFP